MLYVSIGYFNIYTILGFYLTSLHLILYTYCLSIFGQNPKTLVSLFKLNNVYLFIFKLILIFEIFFFQIQPFILL